MVRRLPGVRHMVILLAVITTGFLMRSVAAPSLEAAGSQATPGAVAGKPGLAQKKDDEPALRSFMRQKLDASNRILEGLVTDDLSMVEEGSDILLKMSREERWRASNDMLYRRFSTEFTDAVSDMKEKAAAQSIDKTSLAWINATMQCLKCHEWVRNTVVADGGNAALSPERDEQLRRSLSSITAPQAPRN